VKELDWTAVTEDSLKEFEEVDVILAADVVRLIFIEVYDHTAHSQL
jgi:hypothetical protein